MDSSEPRPLLVSHIVIHTTKPVTDVVLDEAARQAVQMVCAPNGWEGLLTFHAEACAAGVLLTPVTLSGILG
jgi:hypothetical protein